MCNNTAFIYFVLTLVLTKQTITFDVQNRSFVPFLKAILILNVAFKTDNNINKLLKITNI